MDPDYPDKVGEFIELSVNGFGLVKLDGIILVMYNEFTMSYRTISLNGYLTDEAGYLLIGKAGLRPPPDVVIPDDNEPLISGAGGVALYLGNASDFPDFSVPYGKVVGLLDAVVFGLPGNLNSLLRLLYYLTPDQGAIELQPLEDNVLPSILRCHSNLPSTQLAYVQGDPSPGDDNACPLPPIVINELNIITSMNGTAEFLEISSQGTPYFPLDKLSVVLWRSDIYMGAVGAIGLYGWKTDQNGLFLIEQKQVQGTRPSFPVSISDTIERAPGAISIHVARPGMFPPRSKFSNQSLVDALVFGVSKDDFIPQEMIDILTPNRDWIHENELVKYEDVSINRCVRRNGSVEYILDNLSPNATNYCPRPTNSKITINEFHLTAASQMYIELWDMGGGYTEINGLQLVFFQEDGKFSMSQNLTGQTDRHGYFIVGHASRPAPDITIPIRYSLRNGGAVAIYETYQSFVVGDTPTSVGLMSAVVHVLGSLSDAAAENFNILTPESSPVIQTDPSDLTGIRYALSRCFNSSLRVTREAFRPRLKSPRSLNDCPSLQDDVYINEVEVTKPQNFIPFVKDEFIELYDGGRGNTTLQYLTLVLFDGGVPFFGGFSRDVAFYSLSLDGMKTNADGYFVIGSSKLNQSLVDYPVDTSITPFLQLGIVGIALYRAPVGAFPIGSNATSTSLVDAMIYVTGRQEAQHSLVDKLLPDVVGSGMVIETGSWLEGHGSISRCLGNERLNPLVYILTETVTPRKSNNCSYITPNFETDVRISEVNLDRDGFFVELFDLGAGNTSLDTLILVLYGPVLFGSKEEPRSILVVDLHGERTNADGFFVVGSASSSDKQITGNFRDAATGVGLYHARVTQFPGSSLPSPQNLIDAVVGNETSSNPLAGVLLPGQAGVSDGDVEGLERSVSRCFGRLPLDMFAFIPSLPTPGTRNNCSRQLVVINEININHANLAVAYQEFIELYDGGVGHTPLTGTVVVIYNGDRQNLAATVIALNNTQTNANGYFVIGRPNNNFTADLQIGVFGQIIPDNKGAIALYHDDSRNYEVGMQPTNTRLQDAVVYGSQDTTPNAQLIDVFIRGQMQIVEDQGFLNGDESIVRCECCQALNMSVYKQSYPTPGRVNPCVPQPIITTRPPLTPPSSDEVFINEIAIETHFFTKEYIELKGTPSLALDNYFIVLYNIEGLAYFTIQLENTIGPDGYFLIGSANISPPPHVRFPFTIGSYIDEKGGAVALYYGYASDIAKDAGATDKNLIDAVVFTANADMGVGGQADILTKGSEQFYADLQREESITRCYWQSSRNNKDFTQSDRTPGNQNHCPSRDFKRTLQMKLIDANFDFWQNNPELLTSLRQIIIDGVNDKCKCGFTYHYIVGEVLLEGSVVYQADFLAFNTNQSSLIYTSFAEFVSDSKTLVIDGQTYQVDKCVEECVPMPTVPPKTPTPVLSATTKNTLNGTRKGRSGNNTGTAVGLTIGLILLIIIGVVLVFILIRKRIICYNKDTRLTEEGVEYSAKPEGLDALEFRNNTYEPSY
ncbi:uncharacterized protein [Amphiura filiformis]|uniref:uncharacterized protein n=1 Tax=Amphiura filiformis TaxID=82378 RepID=UPI003B220D56